MDREFQSVAHEACRILLRPVASMFLKVGLTWKEFSELAKSVFVETATAEYGIRGRPTNISRVSILTGIGRKEVKRQRELLESAKPSPPQKTTDATRVLSGWYQDPDYTDSDGQPLPLPGSGNELSFESLCRKYGGGVAPATMLKELLHTETIAEAGDGQLIPKRRYYHPARHDDENLLWAVNLIRDLTATMNNNVFKTDQTIPRFGRKAENTEIPESCRESFRQFLDQWGQAFLEDIDDWLTEHATDVEGDASCIRLGVGVFGIEDEFLKE